tara:strand:+ start:211 stop:549 length:339 start_codon:yes stop_codon:yes gene_type:complete
MANARYKCNWALCLRKVMMIDSKLCLTNKDVGKKVYEIENETTYVSRWQVIAKDQDEAFEIWLDQHSQDLKTEDGAADTCVCTYVKDYSQMGDTKEVAEIKYNKEEDEVYII